MQLHYKSQYLLASRRLIVKLYRQLSKDLTINSYSTEISSQNKPFNMYTAKKKATEGSKCKISCPECLKMENFIAEL